MATFYIKHITKYTYSSPVIDGATLLRLHPINDEYQKVESHLISVTNNPYIESFIDFFNNRVGTFMVTEPHSELSIISEIEVHTTERIFPDDSADITSQWKELNRIKNTIEFLDYTKFKPFSGCEDIKNIILDKMLKTKSPFKAVLELCEYVHENFEYKSGITNVNTPIEEAWKLQAGVCQDFTNVLLKMIKMLGLPARYVSGYICPNNTITRGAGATHAWVEVYIPFYGWLGIDPTNNAIANENHVRIAVGRSYSDCSPVKGVYKGNVEAEMEVSVEVKTSQDTIVDTPVFNTSTTSNSYKRNLEVMQQGQQQQ
ncbi:transglutaminase family protein [Algibacter pectinivorans]|uniref:Transglutaminase-like enzyme, putative cysteine protease n=1 Tax=Algibacter pectinivorans TaxID=870482 RepID=A0A1I1PPN4_9FLAO|nr:transglutaminase family protein [Algibacter pectinivorans]SFD11864.1 Transglutaminase-like enzyme, putative cysteine protease [Algibacter pectinivorans]